MRSFAFILAVNCCVVRGATVTQKGNLYINLGLNDVMFTENVTFESTATNVGECALQCNKYTNCLAFTFHENTCRGHEMRLKPNTTSISAPGARSLAKKDEATNSTAIPGVIKCEQTGVKKVRDATLGLDMDVSCEDEWLVFQRRQNEQVDFFRDWRDYADGFGYVEGCGGYWMGLEPLHRITTAGVIYELRIDLVEWSGKATYGIYSNFSVSSEADKFRLNFDSFIDGTLDQSLDVNRGMAFSTKDAKNDLALPNLSCALGGKSGWWFENCGYTNLNGLYLSKYSRSLTGIIWNSHDSKMLTQMMIRPVN